MRETKNIDVAVLLGTLREISTTNDYFAARILYEAQCIKLLDTAVEQPWSNSPFGGALGSSARNRPRVSQRGESMTLVNL